MQQSERWSKEMGDCDSPYDIVADIEGRDLASNRQHHSCHFQTYVE